MSDGSMATNMSYARPVRGTEVDVDAKIKEQATALLKSYEEVGIYKLVKRGSRDVKFTDFPSGKEVKSVTKTIEVLDDPLI
jgi:hypothetical protein